MNMNAPSCATALAREIASHGGDVRCYAPKVVCEALKARFGGRKA
jgi:pantetheine-phosphate adenylyltransferase